MYKILIADDHPLFREAIHNVISDGFPGSEVMETADLDSALNDFAWELEAQDDAHASATFRRHLVRQLGAQVIAQVTETSR